VVNPAAQPAAAQLAQQILANTNVTLKQEIVKIPEFFGEKGKDTVTAQEFVTRIDECQVSNDWNDTMTFANFRLCLRGEADEWLSSTVRHLKLTAAQKTWTRIRPLFKEEFAMTSDDKLIVDGLANLAHRQGENPRKFFSRLEKLFNILHENYASYRIKPERPAPIQLQGTFTQDALTQFANDSVEAYNNFLFAQVFKAAAPENVRKLLSHKDQTRLTVDDTYQTFFTEHRVEQDKCQNTALNVHAIDENVDQEANQNDQNVAAFRPQRPQQQQQQQQFRQQQQYNNRGNRSRGQSSYRGNSNRSNQGSNATRNGKFCIYCKILNHTQEECRKRINDKKPCVNGKGQLYWPKINNITTQSATNDSNNEVDSVFLSRAS
jgi:Zn ribbon nucleic-acid-binding protein